MISFPDWFKELCSNYVWFEPASMRHKPETFKEVCRQVHEQYLAKEQFPPIQEARSYVSNKLNKINPDKTYSKDWVTKALEKHEEDNKEEWTPLTGEERQKRLAEFKAMIDAAPIVNGMPPISKKQAVEEGGWIPAKPAPYPVTTPEEAYVRDRHFEWIKANFEARTGQKLPGFIDEQTWNQIYDDKHLTKEGK